MKVDALTVESEQVKYQTAYSHQNYRSKQKTIDSRLPLVGRVQAGDSYLDVSCGRGEMVDLTRKTRAGCTSRGTEFTQTLVDPARGIEYARLPELEGVAPADYVSCYEILEHVRPHDVLPALDRLVELTQKQLWITTNDRKSWTRYSPKPLNLHLTRLPLRWWLAQLDRLGREHNMRPSYELLRKDRPQIRNWLFVLDRRKPYSLGWLDESALLAEMPKQDYRDLHALYHFWYVPEFPVSALQQTPPSTQMDLPHVKALHADLDTRGIRNPILVHNIPGQKHREYWVRCGNHRRNWALDRGFKTLPAIVYGCNEYLNFEHGEAVHVDPYTFSEIHKFIVDGKLTMEGPDAPDLVGIADWHKGQYP